MKVKIKKLVILIMMVTLLTGCSNSKYQKDESYETEMDGTYNMKAVSVDTDEICLELNYKFSNVTFEYDGYENGCSSNSSGTIEKIDINDSLTSITFNVSETIYNPNKDSIIARSISLKNESIIYKYKNMLGYIYESDNMPTSKTFDYIIYYNDEKTSGLIFSKDGYSHVCPNISNCECNYAKNTQYIRKNDIIYWSYNNSNYWQIEYYIIDGLGLFKPLVYKVEE